MRTDKRDVKVQGLTDQGMLDMVNHFVALRQHLIRCNSEQRRHFYQNLDILIQAYNDSDDKR